MVETETRLLLLRHGEVASHRGDVPVTDAGLDHAERTGKASGADATGALTVLYGGTRRTRETAEALIRGIDDAARVDGPHDSFALRNPDMYLAGTRVNMVSSAAALAEQVPGMTEEQVQENTWWTSVLHLGRPHRLVAEPATAARGVGGRPRSPDPARSPASLADPGPTQGRVVVGGDPLAPAARRLLLAHRCRPRRTRLRHRRIDVRDRPGRPDAASRPTTHSGSDESRRKAPTDGARPRLHRPGPGRPGLDAARSTSGRSLRAYPAP